jgi:hypothetical protein
MHNISYLFSETKRCIAHSSCQKQLKCVNGFCGDPAYFRAFKNQPCKEDRTCEVRNCIREKRFYLTSQDLLTGEMCCFDVSFPHEWRKGRASWTKKCCDNPTGLPVIPPHQNITAQGLREVGFLAKTPPINFVSAGQGPHLSGPIFC